MSSFLNPTFIIAILVAITVHEWAHAYAAYRLGDNTAKYAGRLTLNPLAHLDPLGALMFVVVGFGWAKPVPVDPRNLRNYKWGNTLVALAGPVSNLIVATIAMVLLEILGRHTSNSPMSLLSAQGDSTAMTLAIQLLTSSIFVNLGLMAFNLLPIAPLDGSKILEPFIPLHLQDLYDEAMRRGPMILILLLVAEHFVGIPIISGWVMGIMEFVLTGFVLITTIIPAS
jgi:Zn-dependent protease